MENTGKIRVAQVIGITKEGGVESVIMNYYKNIDRTKVEFDFLVESESKITTKEYVESLGGHLIIIPSYKNPFKYMQSLKKIFKENKYDIVHSNMNTLSVLSLYVAKKAGIKVRIAHSHSTSNPKEKLKNILKNMLRPLSKIYATDYFACSELAGRYLFGNKTFDKGLVTVINNGIDIDKFKYNEEYNISLRKELNIDINTKVIGHVGRFVPQKNHSYLIDIFNEIHKMDSDTKLLLLGDGPLREETELKVRNLQLDDAVIFVGAREDAYKYYSVMNVFILPSLYEGLPVVGVEAQVNGLPCLFSDNVTKEAKLSFNVCFFPINIDTFEWANKAVKSFRASNDKFNVNTSFEGSIYDIKCGADKLLKYYEKMVMRN